MTASQQRVHEDRKQETSRLIGIAIEHLKFIQKRVLSGKTIDMTDLGPMYLDIPSIRHHCEMLNNERS